LGEANPRLDAYFAKARPWRDEMAALRAIVLDCPVVEEIKWRQPCYTYDGANVAIIGAFKAFCTLSFFKGVLLKDPENILVAPGENTRSGRLVKITGLGEIAPLEPVLKRYVLEAIEVEKAGLTVEFRKDDLDPPEELVRALEEDPALQAAFEALTPGRRRGYILHFSQPKQSASRTARIARARPRIFDGKGFNER
jgi:uncharacterized protein YdeI (YjbR/CyaY-like superfamily)